MKLPGRDSVQVSRAKAADYLLSSTHPVGMYKARFFRKLGFDATRPEELIARLIEVGQTGDVRETVKTAFGSKHIVEGMLCGPGGSSALVRTVWIVGRHDSMPRLVTAYPA